MKVLMAVNFPCSTAFIVPGKFLYFVPAVGISGFVGESVMWWVSETCLMRKCLAEADIWEGILLRTVRVFFWKVSGVRAGDVLLEWMLEMTIDVWKEYKYSPIDGMTLWHWFVLLVFVDASLILIFACHDFIERSAPKNFWRCFGCFLLISQTCADQWSLNISSGLSCCC